jgi:hypothetical protein
VKAAIDEALAAMPSDEQMITTTRQLAEAVDRLEDHD